MAEDSGFQVIGMRPAVGEDGAILHPGFMQRGDAAGVNRNSMGYWPVPIMLGMPGGMQLEVSLRTTPLLVRTSFCQAW
jgi:hypothetical protein